MLHFQCILKTVITINDVGQLVLLIVYHHTLWQLLVCTLLDEWAIRNTSLIVTWDQAFISTVRQDVSNKSFLWDWRIIDHRPQDLLIGLILLVVILFNHLRCIYILKHRGEWSQIWLLDVSWRLNFHRSSFRFFLLKDLWQLFLRWRTFASMIISSHCRVLILGHCSHFLSSSSSVPTEGWLHLSLFLKKLLSDFA